MEKYNRYTTRIKNKDKKTDFIILAAGIGNRTKSYGTKSLWYIDDKTLIETQINTIKKVYPESNIYIIIGFEADKIISLNLPVSLIENQLYEQQGQLGSLRLGFLSTKNDVVIIHGDILFNEDTIVNIIGKSKLIIDSKKRMSDGTVGIRYSNKVENINYCWDTKWAQICYLSGFELELMRQFCLNTDNNKLLTYEGLEWIINSNGKLEVSEPEKAKFREINEI